MIKLSCLILSILFQFQLWFISRWEKTVAPFSLCTMSSRVGITLSVRRMVWLASLMSTFGSNHNRRYPTSRPLDLLNYVISYQLLQFFVRVVSAWYWTGLFCGVGQLVLPYDQYVNPLLFLPFFRFPWIDHRILRIIICWYLLVSLHCDGNQHQAKILRSLKTYQSFSDPRVKFHDRLKFSNHLQWRGGTFLSLMWAQNTGQLLQFILVCEYLLKCEFIHLTFTVAPVSLQTPWVLSFQLRNSLSDGLRSSLRSTAVSFYTAQGIGIAAIWEHLLTNCLYHAKRSW